MTFVGLLALGIAIGTWLVGWWAVPIIALGIGFYHRSENGRSGRVALAATVGWGLLLLIDIARGPFGAVTATLAGTMGLPGPVLLAATLTFPALLGWSAASIAAAASKKLAERHLSRA